MYRDSSLESKLYEIGLRAGFTSAGIPDIFEGNEAYIQGYNSGKRAFEELKNGNPYGAYYDTIRPPAL